MSDDSPLGECVWAVDPDTDSDLWETDCGRSFLIYEGGPQSHNKMKFCCYCGLPLVEKENE